MTAPTGERKSRSTTSCPLETSSHGERGHFDAMSRSRASDFGFEAGRICECSGDNALSPIR